MASKISTLSLERQIFLKKRHNTYQVIRNLVVVGVMVVVVVVISFLR
jgi:hypothetical protein